MKDKDSTDRLAAARPSIPEGDPVEEQARSRARSLLRAEMAAAAERRSPPRRRRLVLRGALVFAVLAAATLIGLDLGLPGKSSKVGPQVASASTLEQFARLVAAAPSKPLQPGQYYYLKVLSGSGLEAVKSSSGAYQNAAEEEIWIGADGSGLVLSPGYAQRYSAADPMPMLRFQGVELDYRGLLALPTEPKALERWLARESSGNGPETQDVELVMIGELLGRTPAPPKLRAALYRLIDSFPSTRAEGRVLDPLGRKGMGFERHMAGCKLQPEATCDWEIILDQKTGNLLASRRFLSNGGPNWEAVVKTGIVSLLKKRPS
jgi:hypothetical protein